MTDFKNLGPDMSLFAVRALDSDIPSVIFLRDGHSLSAQILTSSGGELTTSHDSTFHRGRSVSPCSELRPATLTACTSTLDLWDSIACPPSTLTVL